MKNIVIINDFDYIQGGASKVAIETANIFAQKKYNVYFFSGATMNSDELDKKVINVCTNQGEALKNKNKIKGMINNIYNFKAKNKLSKLLDTLDKKETIIHVHGWTKCLSSSVFDIAFKKGFKVVLTVHDYFTACPNGGYFDYKKNQICHLKPLSMKCLKCNCDSRNYGFKIFRVIRQFVQNKIVKVNKKLENVITISKLIEDVLKSNFNENINIRRINNPIDFAKEKEKINILKNDYYVYVGRVSKEKGVKIFCEAISNLKIKGVVVGAGDELESLKINYPNIKFVGWKMPNEVREYMKNAKCLIFPSLWYEGAPLTILEAMSIGLPSIISNTNSGIEIIEDSKNGMIFKSNDVEDLCKKINQYEKLNLEKISKNAYDSFWNSNYDLNSYYKSTEKFYKEILKKEK